ncbi:glycosyltransferase family 4 protein [Segetibacter aerophilus]|uniref:Glycoside hydrolase n=1 Tax=Segetibacter aerophilus TaxID=670293 RepID=A0A512BDA5_9BACT|nr:glycosyltransferase family 4 protein [Segetibacter aerophilus]GEO09943.1 glycoside hydrolase [Segetibacter aerophilus]
MPCNNSSIAPSSGASFLIISSEFPPNVGGIGNHAYNLAKALSEEGFQVEVLADIINVPDKDLADFAAKETFTIHWVSRQGFVAQTYFERIARAFSLAAKSEKVICSGKFSLWTAALLKARYPKKEFIAVVHGTELDLKAKAAKKLTSYSLGRFNKIISVSNYTRQFLPASLPSHILQSVIHNGINEAEFEMQTVPGLPGNPALITIGNVTDRKGQENVIAALPQILGSNPSARYHIVGKPTKKETIETKSKKLGVQDAIEFYGAVSRVELLQKLKGATIKLMLSNHTADGDFEGFGIAVLEANAFGVPAIGSKDCGIADAIKHGETGLLVDQYKPKEVADAVSTILKDYQRFSENAKNWARQHDWKIIVKKYVEAFNA